MDLIAKKLSNEPLKKEIFSLIALLADAVERLFELSRKSHQEVIQLRYSRYLALAISTDEGALDTVKKHIRQQVVKGNNQVKKSAEEACELFEQLNKAILEQPNNEQGDTVAAHGTQYILGLVHNLKLYKEEKVQTQYQRLLKREREQSLSSGTSAAETYIENIKNCKYLD